MDKKESPPKVAGGAEDVECPRPPGDRGEVGPVSIPTPTGFVHGAPSDHRPVSFLREWA